MSSAVCKLPYNRKDWQTFLRVCNSNILLSLYLSCALSLSLSRSLSHLPTSLLVFPFPIGHFHYLTIYLLCSLFSFSSPNPLSFCLFHLLALFPLSFVAVPFRSSHFWFLFRFLFSSFFLFLRPLFPPPSPPPFFFVHLHLFTKKFLSFLSPWLVLPSNSYRESVLLDFIQRILLFFLCR